MSHEPSIDWRDKIQIGDVLENKGGQRIVRKVSYDSRGKLRFVHFAIKRCSWTHACYTLYSRYELDYLGYRPTGVRKTKMTLLDKRILHDIMAHGKIKRTLDCCDVKGIA